MTDAWPIKPLQRGADGEVLTHCRSDAGRRVLGDPRLAKLDGPERDLVRFRINQVGAFRDLCEAVSSLPDGDEWREGFDEIDWNGLCLGFMLASEDYERPKITYEEAFDLARICRYTFEYWS